MNTSLKPIKLHQSKDADWQKVNELAFAYYQDQTNKDKRKALYDALTKDRFKPKKVKGKVELVRSPSLLLQLAREVIGWERKADLGAGLTDLTHDILQDALEKKDATSGLPIFRATGLLGGFFTKQYTDEDGKAIETIEWTPGKFDPDKGAKFKTFFNMILTSQMRDYANKYNNARRKNLGLKDGLRPLPNAKETDDKQQEQTPEELATYGAGRRKEAHVQLEGISINPIPNPSPPKLSLKRYTSSTETPSEAHAKQPL